MHSLRRLDESGDSGEIEGTITTFLCGRRMAIGALPVATSTPMVARPSQAGEVSNEGGSQKGAAVVGSGWVLGRCPTEELAFEGESQPRGWRMP